MASPFIDQGDIHLVPDEEVPFVEAALPAKGPRKMHEMRPILVVQCQGDCDDSSVPAVMAAAGSHLTHTKRDSDIILQKGEGGLEQRTVFMLGQVFPILKSEIQRGKKVGNIGTERLEDVKAILACNFGMIAPTGS